MWLLMKGIGVWGIERKEGGRGRCGETFDHILLYVVGLFEPCEHRTY